MSNILQKQVNFVQAPNVPGGTQVQVAYSGRVQVTLPTLRSIVKAWINGTVATGATLWRLSVYRGNGLTGPNVGGLVQLTAVAGNTQEMSIQVSEQLLNMEFVDYTLGFQAGGASAASSIGLVMLEVELING